jgi:hypothetical protein
MDGVEDTVYLAGRNGHEKLFVVKFVEIHCLLLWKLNCEQEEGEKRYLEGRQQEM